MRIAALLVGSLLLATSAMADASRDLLSSGKADEAISNLNSRIRANSSDAEAHNLLCRTYWALEDWDRAVSNCEKAVQLNGQSSEFHHWLGRAYGEKADHSSFLSAAGLAKKVRIEFERATQLDPGNLSARLDLAEFYLEAPGIVGGGQDKARAQAIIIGRQDSAKEHWVYARIAEKNKDAATAEKEYRAAIASGKNNSETWLNLAMFLRRQKRYDEMEAAIRKATTPPVQPPEVFVESADTLIRAGRDFPFAEDLLKRYLAGTLVEEAPAFRAQYLLGSLMEKQGNRTGAAQAYKSALALAHKYERAQQALQRVAP